MMRQRIPHLKSGEGVVFRQPQSKILRHGLYSRFPEANPRGVGKSLKYVVTTRPYHCTLFIHSISLAI
jgi:hypothetical protein